MSGTESFLVGAMVSAGMFLPLVFSLWDRLTLERKFVATLAEMLGAKNKEDQAAHVGPPNHGG